MEYDNINISNVEEIIAQNIDRAIVKARYNMSGYSVEERKRPGPDRRTMACMNIIQNFFLNTSE